MLSTLLLLQQRDLVPAADLAEQLEGSVRTVYRDVEALSSVGVPVYAERGKYSDIRLFFSLPYRHVRAADRVCLEIERIFYDTTADDLRRTTPELARDPAPAVGPLVSAVVYLAELARPRHVLKPSDPALDSCVPTPCPVPPAARYSAAKPPNAERQANGAPDRRGHRVVIDVPGVVRNGNSQPITGRNRPASASAFVARRNLSAAPNCASAIPRPVMPRARRSSPSSSANTPLDAP